MIPYETTHPNGLALSCITVTTKKFVVLLKTNFGRGKTYVATENLTLALNFAALKTGNQ